MANATITVLEADGVTETDVTVLGLDRQAAAASKSVTLATEDKAQLDAAVTALQLIDDPVATLGTTTYTEAASKGMVVGAVRRDANTSLVDTTNEVAPLQVNATGELKVAQIQALPAGTNAIGKLAANSGVDIGDVDVTSVPTDPFGANVDAASATGSISAKLRGIATALGVTAFDLGSGTGGSRTLRWFHDTAQWIGGAGNVTSATQRTTLAADDPAVAVLGSQADAASATTSIKAALRAIATALGTTALDLGSGTGGSRTLRTILDTTQVASVLDCSTTVTRPADTNAYTANDAFSNSTSAPTAGGFTFTNAAAASGGGGIITDAIIVASAGTLYQGEIWLFDSAATAINDNAAFSLSDSDALLALGKIPFTLAVEAVNNSSAHVTGLNISYHCVGTANLRFLIKILNAPTPASAETLTVRIKGIRS